MCFEVYTITIDTISTSCMSNLRIVCTLFYEIYLEQQLLSPTVLLSTL